MKQIHFVKLLFVVSFLFIIGTIPMRGETATITFKSQSTGTSDGNTEYTTKNFVSNGINSNDATFGTISCSATSKCYSGKSGYGMKIGTSSNSGSFTISFTAISNVTGITINCASYSASNKSCSITVKNGSTTLGTHTTSSSSAAFSDAVISGLNIASLSTLTLSTTKYCYVKSITLTYSSSGSTETTVYFHP